GSGCRMDLTRGISQFGTRFRLGRRDRHVEVLQVKKRGHVFHVLQFLNHAGHLTQNSSFDLPTLSALRIQMSLSPFHWTDWVNLGLLPLTPTSRLLYCGLSMPEKVADT